MICGACRRAADIVSGRLPLPTVKPLARARFLREVSAHIGCTGCDCQHKTAQGWVEQATVVFR